MKFVISFLFTISAAWGAPIQIFHEGGVGYALGIKRTLMTDYTIPEELIMMEKVSDCSIVSGKGKLDLCLKNNGDLILVSVEREFVNESLRIFRAP